MGKEPKQFTVMNRKSELISTLEMVLPESNAYANLYLFLVFCCFLRQGSSV